MCMSIFNMEPPMKSSDTLRQLEQCYERYLPAEEKSYEAFIWFSRIPHPFLNAVMHLAPDGNMQSLIDRIIRNAPSGLPYSFWVPSDPESAPIAAYLAKNGFAPALTCSLMRWNVEPVKAPDADIRMADLAIFNELLSSVFQFDETVKNGFSDFLKKGPCENVLLYVGGRPVSTGTLIPCGYHGGIFNESFLPGDEAHGKTVIQYLMHRASSLRMQQLVVLSAPDYEKIYLQLGFEKTGEINLYIPSLNK